MTDTINDIIIKYIANKAGIQGYAEVIEMLVPKNNEYVYIFYRDKDSNINCGACTLILQHVPMLRQIAERFGNLDRVKDSVLKHIEIYE
jgi:hypothetical protein